MKINTEKPVSPLDSLTLNEVEPGMLFVLDGAGVEYVRGPTTPQMEITVGGALGTHTILNLDAENRLIATASFRAEAKTQITDGTGRYARLLEMMHRTMVDSAGGATSRRVGEKTYRYFICWLRDHTHTLKGMKYFDGDLKTGLELYADTQRADGMIYDRIAGKADVQGWRDVTFKVGDFIRTLDGGTANSSTLQRIPVENDVEFLFLECLYQTWHATGDTEWMGSYLDAAIKAVAYATSDPCRWSEKFQLLKRGYTIDTWDFIHSDDGALTTGDNIVDLEKSTFGVMHGDNTGMAAALRYLAEMLEAAGRADEAPAYRTLADDLMERLNALSWNGGHYRHHVSEDPSFVRDVGSTDEAVQVSMSNAYALNRGIGDEKCKAIIQTYQRIRREMPSEQPGEFFNIYPPFEHGFSAQNSIWQYMNGGVSSIVAGELARGAFENGSEAYGADILDRLLGLSERHNGRLHVCFNGNPQTEPSTPRAFTPVDLSAQANVSTSWKPVGGWWEEGNDLSQMPVGEQTFEDIPFVLENRGLGLAMKRPGYTQEIDVPINESAASLYLFHTAATGGESLLGEMEVHYADGETVCEVISLGKQLESWFMPDSSESTGTGCHAPRLSKGWPPYQLAWRGGNELFENVGLFIWGWDNPRPEVTIQKIILRTLEKDNAWFIPGLTLCDQPVWFPQSDLSFGIPDCWGAAAVVFALLEGLAGVVDHGPQFETTTLTPRWLAAGETQADAVVHYPASGGYAAYRWQATEIGQQMQLTGSADKQTVRLLLPEEKRVRSVILNGESQTITIETVDQSRYAIVVCSGRGAFSVELLYG